MHTHPGKKLLHGSTTFVYDYVNSFGIVKLELETGTGNWNWRYGISDGEEALMPAVNLETDEIFT